jgi:hypothetical protein
LNGYGQRIWACDSDFDQIFFLIFTESFHFISPLSVAKGFSPKRRSFSLENWKDRAERTGTPELEK